MNGDIESKYVPFAGQHEEAPEKIELPCKDLDMDCLPDSEGDIPFGGYGKCYEYFPEQGKCPFLPL